MKISDPKATRQVKSAKRFIVLSAVLTVGCAITISCILLSSYLINTSISSSGIFLVSVIGMFDFILGCPLYYYFRFDKNTLSTSKHSVKFPYSILLFVPPKISKQQCLKWLCQTITYALMGILSGLLCLILIRMFDKNLPKDQYISIFLNGTLISYITGFISLCFNSQVKQDNKNDNATIDNTLYSKVVRVLSQNPYYPVAIVLILSIILSLSYMVIHIESFPIIGCILICFSLLLGIVISSLFLRLLSQNKILQIKAQDTSSYLQYMSSFAIETERLTKENDILKNQKSILFKEKRELINVLCREYTDNWNSQKLRPLILNKINNEITKLQTNAFKQSLEKEIIEYYGDLFKEIREKQLLKPDEIYFLLLIIAGYSQKAISIIMSIHPKTFYTKKYRLTEKIENFEINNKTEILNMLSPIKPK